jgi:hypothetical protein
MEYLRLKSRPSLRFADTASPKAHADVSDATLSFPTFSGELDRKEARILLGKDWHPGLTERY